MIERGTHLGVYEVLEPIGSGGMGDVYRARDRKLGREVAIKVLPEAFGQDRERVARFEREAKVLASLNHPGIATLHGLENVDGLVFLVMELIEGETLAERIARGAVPLEEARGLFRQFATALEAAHARGIVHRDLKPANVKITPEGNLKILDFGLAKQEVRGPSLDALSQSPTVTKDTALGTILGTAAYMSPEQARGASVDERADIWGFGCCFYEALTGRRAFIGDSLADVMAAVIHKEPEWSLLSPRVPQNVETLVRRCLRKEPRQRLQAMGDARIELEDVQTEARPQVAERRRPRTIPALLIGILAGIAMALIVDVTRTPTREVGTTVVPRQLTSNPVENGVRSAAISPDGRYLAFIDMAGLHIRLLETGETHDLEIPADFALGEVDWYPDGTSLLFDAFTEEGSGIWRVPVLGGKPRKLAEGGWRATISPDGAAIAYLNVSLPSRRVFVMGPNGEGARAFLEASGASLFELAWSSDGKWLLLGSSTIELSANTIEAVRRDGSVRKTVLTDARLFQSWRGALPFCWTADNRLIYARREPAPNRESSNLWAVAIDPASAEIVGEPEALTSLAGINFKDLSVTTDGSLLTFLLERNQADVFVSALDESGTRLTSERRLTLDDANDYPTGWLDGETLLIRSDRAGSDNPYRQGLYETTASNLYPSATAATGAQLDATGSWILFWSASELLRMPVSGGPAEQILVSEDSAPRFRCVTGVRCILGERDEETKEFVFFALDPVAGRAEEIARIEDRPPFTNWDLSPDGERAVVVHNDGPARVVDLTKDSVTELVDEDWLFGEFVGWDATGKGIYTDGQRRQQGGPVSYRKRLVYAQLSPTVQVYPLRNRPGQWHVHPFRSPDGHHLAFAAMTFSGNAWMLEDF